MALVPTPRDLEERHGQAGPEGSAGGAACNANGSFHQCGAGHLGSIEHSARRHVRALPQNQEFPLARVGSALSRLSPASRRAWRSDFCHHGCHCRTGAQDWGHDIAVGRAYRTLAARTRQRCGVRGARLMLAELRDENKQLAARMRETHGLCDEHDDVATASLLEVWIDEAERRTWFLFEAGRR